MASCATFNFVLQYLFTDTFTPSADMYGSALDCINMCYYDNSCASVLYDNDTQHCVLTKDLLSMVTMETAVEGETGYWYYGLHTDGCDWTNGWNYHRPSRTCVRNMTPLKMPYLAAEALCDLVGASIITGDNPSRAQLQNRSVEHIGEDIWVAAEHDGTAWKWTSGTLVDPEMMDTSCSSGDCLIANENGYCTVPCSSWHRTICQTFLTEN